VKVEKPDRIAARLRAAHPPIITRIEDDRLCFDPRTVLSDQDSTLINTLKNQLTESR
jgi:hypothetical protein